MTYISWYLSVKVSFCLPLLKVLNNGTDECELSDECGPRVTDECFQRKNDKCGLRMNDNFLHLVKRVSFVSNITE